MIHDGLSTLPALFCPDLAVEDFGGTMSGLGPMLIEISLETSKTSGHGILIGGSHQLFVCR